MKFKIAMKRGMFRKGVGIALLAAGVYYIVRDVQTADVLKGTIFAVLGVVFYAFSHLRAA